MFDFKIVREEFPEPGPEGTPVMMPWLTFHVSDDGLPESDTSKNWLPSLKWFRECSVEGLPSTYYIDRCIARLKMGASREAFGDSMVVLKDGNPVAYTVPRKGSPPGRAEVYQDPSPPETVLVPVKEGVSKLREVRKGWKAKLDGKELPQTFPSQNAARSACAIHAFMTRAKLGAIPMVLERLKEDFPDAKSHQVWACPDENGVRATVDDAEYIIGWDRDKTTNQLVVAHFKPRVDAPTTT